MRRSGVVAALGALSRTPYFLRISSVLGYILSKERARRSRDKNNNAAFAVQCSAGENIVAFAGQKFIIYHVRDK